MHQDSNVLTPVRGRRRAIALPRTIADQTRRVYDTLALIYPLSTRFFHSKAHGCALDMSGLRDGMRVLEIATGSGEMFRRLVRANPSGLTIGLDLSPNMAARTQRRIRSEFPRARADCKAVDARQLPFLSESFDAIFSCYLLELLSSDDILRTLREIRRVLKPGAAVTLVLIGENAEMFNRAYRVAGSVVPAFWGRQLEGQADNLLQAAGLEIVAERTLRQSFYPSRVVHARRAE